jgi:succinyl-diaminopimelate desuccinylase
MNLKELVGAVQEAELVEYCREMVRIKSVNPPGDEMAMAEYVANVLKSIGLEVKLLKHSSSRASVLAILRGSGQAPALLYSAHLDTVPLGAEQWIHEPFAAETLDGKIWGRGSADMKGGLAALLVMAKIVANSGLSIKGDLIFAITAGEEVDSLGAKSVASYPDLGPVQAIIVPEPSYNDIYIAEKGALWLEISTYGKTAHGSMPALGKNAVMMMVGLIKGLENFFIPFESHAMLGGFSMSINTISGGIKTNVVPDRCVVSIDMRTVPGQDHHDIMARFQDLIKDLGKHDPDFKASIEITNDRPPIETSPKEPVVKMMVDIVADITGEIPIPKGVNYYTDAATLAPAFKAPMIICGPGHPGLAHQPNEYVEIEKLVQAAKIYTAATHQFLL